MSRQEILQKQLRVYYTRSNIVKKGIVERKGYEHFSAYWQIHWTLIQII